VVKPLEASNETQAVTMDATQILLAAGLIFFGVLKGLRGQSQSE